MNVLKPTRVIHTGVQYLDGTPARVFPLYCPVRTTEWIDGWDPVRVYTDSGLVERDCTFITREDGQDSVWTVTFHDPDACHLELVKVTPGVAVCRIEILVLPVDETRARASVTCAHTSLGPPGDALLAGLTEAHYERRMRTWETSINHYLRTGTCLAAPVG